VQYLLLEISAHGLLLLFQTFSTPNHHPRSKPFVDHVMTFSIADDRVWFRNFQILQENGEMVEIGERSLVVALRFLFSGQMFFFFCGDLLVCFRLFVLITSIVYVIQSKTLKINFKKKKHENAKYWITLLYYIALRVQGGPKK